jgi:hypothetical protein
MSDVGQIEGFNMQSTIHEFETAIGLSGFKRYQTEGLADDYRNGNLEIAVIRAIGFTYLVRENGQPAGKRPILATADLSDTETGTESRDQFFRTLKEEMTK